MVFAGCLACERVTFDKINLIVVIFSVCFLFLITKKKW